MGLSQPDAVKGNGVLLERLNVGMTKGWWVSLGGTTVAVCESDAWGGSMMTIGSGCRNFNCPLVSLLPPHVPILGHHPPSPPPPFTQGPTMGWDAVLTSAHKGGAPREYQARSGF